MARLRVFVSSTYFDLRHIRSGMEGFIESMGYSPVLFESGDIPFHHDITLADACYNEVQNSHMLILIVGGRYGSAAEEKKKNTSDSEISKMYETYNSVTKKEYETARAKDIPIFIFVEKGVKAEYETFKSNRKNDTIKYAHVDNVNVFLLLDEILSQKRNNFAKEFEKLEDITIWLREQWAGIFADLLTKKNEAVILKDMSSQISELSQVSRVMKEYTESIMRKVQPDNFEKIIIKEEERLRTARIKRFTNEPLIQFLMSEGSIRKLSSLDIFSAFEEADDLFDFLKRSKCTQKFIKEISETHIETAQKDFDKMKNHYLNNLNDDDLLFPNHPVTRAR